MPELPEVETVRRALEKRLRGARLLKTVIPKETFYREPPRRRIAALSGNTLKALRRRGKYLLLDFSNGETLTLHLGMSGRLFLGNEAGPHCRFSMHFDAGDVFFIDPRRFGQVGCALPRLGPEPLSEAFNPAYLADAIRGRRAALKALLMDQKVVAGVGNIYATEALYHAGLRPGRAARSLNRKQIKKLALAVKAVIRDGIERKGSTLDDKSFLDPYGKPGSMQKRVAVYGQKHCPCGAALKKTRARISGRTSLYCPRCQA